MHPQTLPAVVPPASARLAPGGAALLIAGAGWALLLIAASLAPQAGGVGTHEQLNLPPCSYLVRTGRPCPACGMTTAFAACARGQFGRAFRAQPAGVVLFMATLAASLAATGELVLGTPLLGRIRFGVRWIPWVVGAVLSGWAMKLAACA